MENFQIHEERLGNYKSYIALLDRYVRFVITMFTTVLELSCLSF